MKFDGINYSQGGGGGGGGRAPTKRDHFEISIPGWRSGALQYS